MAVRLAPEPMDPLKGSSNISRVFPMPNRGSSREVLRAFSNVLYDCLHIIHTTTADSSLENRCTLCLSPSRAIK